MRKIAVVLLTLFTLSFSGFSVFAADSVETVGDTATSSTDSHLAESSLNTSQEQLKSDVVVNDNSYLTTTELTSNQDSNNVLVNDGDIVSVPEELLDENATNSSKSLEAFLATCSGKTVIFPANKTFVVDEPVSIANVKDIEIDFNYTTLKLPDGFAGWDANGRYTNSTYVGYSIIAIVDVENVAIYRLNLDGNSQNIVTTVTSIGIWLENASDIYFEDLSVKNVNYHGIVVGKNTKSIHFEEVYLTDNCGSNCSSDVYINNSIDDDCSFNNVTAKRSVLDSTGQQVFYVDGYNSKITNLSTYNCTITLDYRRGTHLASDVNIDNCNATVHIQSTTDEDLPEITVTNLTATNIYAGLNTRSGLGIWNAKSAYLENISLSFADDSNTNWWGIVIRRFAGNDVISNVHFKNLTIENARNAAIYYNNLDSSTLVENLTTVGTSQYLFRSENCTAAQEIETITSPIKKIYDKNNTLDLSF